MAVKKTKINYSYKPPMGIKPKYIVDKIRRDDILQAMIRYNNDGIQIPKDWINELIVLNS
jgi:hypothetical protein